MLGVKYLELALAKSDYLISNINSNDKEPSWDGTVEIYKNAGNTHSKTDLEGIAKVQVKGHIDSNTTKKSIHYPVETADLRNYLVDGGTIFFVIYIDYTCIYPLSQYVNNFILLHQFSQKSFHFLVIFYIYHFLKSMI